MIGINGSADRQLDDMLRKWHHWSKVDEKTGFYKTNAACSLYRSSRQYDSVNGVAEQDQEQALMQHIDAAVDRLRNPYWTAIHLLARNLATNRWAWDNPHMPTEPHDLSALIRVARNQMAFAIGIELG